MDPDYEKLVDRIAALEEQKCRLSDGSSPERPPDHPVWKELQSLTEEWEKRSAALIDDLTKAEAAEAKERQDVDAENWKLAAHRRAQRLIVDFWRVHSNCGNGF